MCPQYVYQNFPNSYLLFTKVSMHLSISHSLCSAVHNYDSLCRRSSRSPIMLSILLVTRRSDPIRTTLAHAQFGGRTWTSDPTAGITDARAHIRTNTIRHAVNFIRSISIRSDHHPRMYIWEPSTSLMLRIYIGLAHTCLNKIAG